LRKKIGECLIQQAHQDEDLENARSSISAGERLGVVLVLITGD